MATTTTTNIKIAAFFTGAEAKAKDQAEYNLSTNVPEGIMSAEDAADATHAIKAGVVHAIGELNGWDIYKAIEFAALILEDSNLHDEAAIVTLMGKNIEEGGSYEAPRA